MANGCSVLIIKYCKTCKVDHWVRHLMKDVVHLAGLISALLQTCQRLPRFAGSNST